MRKSIFIIILLIVLASLIFNLIYDFDVLATIMHLVALIGLLTVGRPYIHDKKKRKNH